MNQEMFLSHVRVSVKVVPINLNISAEFTMEEAVISRGR